MRVLFLCSHGAAKSVMAAAWFNRLAEKHALPFVATAASVEDPYQSVPEPVAGLLLRDGFDVRAFTPRPAGEQDIHDAEKIVAIGCELPGIEAARWDDVPAASDDLEGSSAAIRRHVETLIEELLGQR
jgi:arsenate reductase (thioredoxin)